MVLELEHAKIVQGTARKPKDGSGKGKLGQSDSRVKQEWPHTLKSLDFHFEWHWKTLGFGQKMNSAFPYDHSLRAIDE